MARYVVGNWKMNLGLTESEALAKGLLSRLDSGLDGAQCWLAPPFTALSTVARTIEGSKLKVGAQDCHWMQSGAHTGEISAEMLTDLGCSFVIIGHSERRTQLHESAELCVLKAGAAIAAGLTVVFCIGESLEQREQAQTKEVLCSLLEPLSTIKPTPNQIILAYEPVWAIGASKPASPEIIEETVGMITEIWAEKVSTEVPAILYGGSIDPNNFADILAIKNVAGGLVGGASLDPEKFYQLCKIASEVTP